MRLHIDHSPSIAQPHARVRRRPDYYRVRGARMAAIMTRCGTFYRMFFASAFICLLACLIAGVAALGVANVTEASTREPVASSAAGADCGSGFFYGDSNSAPIRKAHRDCFDCTSCCSGLEFRNVSGSLGEAAWTTRPSCKATRPPASARGSAIVRIKLLSFPSRAPPSVGAQRNGAAA
jgi:hypothetical protein